MTRSADSWRPFLRLVRHDLLDPFPGRLAQSWRIALTCALATMVAVVYGIPEPALSCYLVVFLMGIPDTAVTTLKAIGMAVLVLLVVAVTLVIIRWTIEAPSLRVLAIAAASLILLYLGSASQLGEIGGIIALVIAFILTLLDYAFVGEVVTRGLLYATLMATMPMACIVLVNLVTGPNPIRLLRRTVATRLEACAAHLEHADAQTQVRLDELTWPGQEDRLKTMLLARALALGRRAEMLRLARALQESYRAALALTALPPDTPASLREPAARCLREAAQAFAAGNAVPEPPAMPAGASATMQAVWDAMRDMAGTPARYPISGPSEGFLRADALTNPQHLGYAVKTTAAAITCYVLYTLMQWQGIHTAMITCYVAALASTGETTHKLVLRICGCLVGAALGIGSILFLMPHMTSVGAIMLLIFCGTFVGAWIWVGNERVAYAGVQVALAFLLTVLQGNGPTFDMDTARDRIVGVLLGNVVLYFFFTQLWPVSVLDHAWDSTRQAIGQLARMAGVGASRRPAMSPEDARDLQLADASRVAAHAEDTRRALSFENFESYLRRPSEVEIARLTGVDAAVRAVCVDLVVGPAPGEDVSRRLETLSARARRHPPAGPAAPSPTAAPAAALPAPLARHLDRLEILIDGR